MCCIKKALLIVLIVGACREAYSQNAFYDAIRIYNWSTSLKENTPPNDTIKNKADSIAAIILKYTKKHQWENLLAANSSLFKRLYDKYLLATNSMDVNRIIRNLDTIHSTGTPNSINSLINRLKNLSDAFKGKASIFKQSKSKADLFPQGKSWREVKENIEKTEYDITSTINEATTKARKRFDDSVYKTLGVDTLAADTVIRNKVKVIADSDKGRDSLNRMIKYAEDSVYNDSSKFYWKKRGDDDSLLQVAKEAIINEVNVNRNNLSGLLISRSNIVVTLMGDAVNRTLNERSGREADNSEITARKQNTTSLSNFSFPGTTEIVNALAVYLAKRMKQEAIIYFSQQLKKRLDDNAGILKTLFSNTLGMLESWDDDGGTVAPNFGSAWRYSFSKDLSLLPDSMISFCNKDSLLDNITGKLFYDAFEVGKLIKDKYTFIETVQKLTIPSELRSSCFLKSFQLIDVINRELFDSASSKNYWLGFNGFTRMADDPEFFKIFISLLIEKYSDIDFSTAIGINHATIIPADGIASVQEVKIKGWFGKVLISLNHFQSVQNTLAGSQDNDFNLSSYWQMFGGIIDQAVDTSVLFRAEGPTFRNDISLVSSKIRDGMEVYDLLQQKNYAASAFKVIDIFSAIEKSSSKTKLGDQLTADARKLINFLADVLSAKNSDDLTKAIESNALPPSSYRLRYKYKSVWDIGAYVGMYAGAEFVQDKVDRIRYANPGFVYGLTAPVGVNYTLGRSSMHGGKTKPAYWTFSLSIIDIGAVVAYRLSNDDDAPLPASITWSQIISPGLYVRKNFTNSPFVWFVGAQYAPKLRTLDKTDFRNTVRFNAGLAFDMPLFIIKRSPVLLTKQTL